MVSFSHEQLQYVSKTNLCVVLKSQIVQCTEVRFASFFSGGFITAIVVNPPERKLQNALLCSVVVASFPHKQFQCVVFKSKESNK